MSLEDVLKSIPILDKYAESFFAWNKTRKRINQVKTIEKIVDNSDDVALANLLHEIADKIEKRNQTN